MRVRDVLKRLPPRPIAHYALALLVVLLVGIGVLAAFVYIDTARLKQQIAESENRLARQELDDAVALLRGQAQNAALALMQWDEARQQLDNPVYYGYWRNSRALAAGVIPESLDAVELYDKQGRLLSTAAEGPESDMPERIDEKDMEPYLLREGDHDHLYFFFPFYHDASQTQLIGYSGFKYDFQEELGKLRKFRYLDRASIQVGAEDGERIPLADVLSVLEFKTVGNPETHALERIFSRSYYEIGALVLSVSLIGYFALVSVVARPLRRLSGHIDAMRRGKEGVLDASYQGLLAVTELENVRQSLNDYQRQLDDMHVSLAHKNRELWTLAHHDPLTGIYNRRAFEDDWRAMQRANADLPADVAFLLFDCDHFKAINDTYGHQVGDQVLVALAEALLAALRTGDRLYRLGGDEFATILLATDIAQAQQVAERCLEQVQASDFVALGVKEPVRISVGIACLEGAHEDALKTLHRRADLAMYHAKRPGHGKVAVYSPEMGEGQEALVSSAETSAIYEAMADPGKFEMHYQPVLGLPGARIEYYEALVRIRGSEGLITPARIFPVVEMRGIESEFDLAVLEGVRRDLETGRIPKGSGVSFNVSGPGIVNARVNEKLLEYVPLLASYKLVIEVTETSLITQIAQASSNLSRLRRHGFTVALDDFGSGYSSLRYLAGMPVDLVKFDISMVRSLEESGRQAVFVEDLARLIKDAGYRLVAEGIESESLLQKVMALGFSHAQGFHIGRPVPLDSLLRVSLRAVG